MRKRKETEVKNEESMQPMDAKRIKKSRRGLMKRRCRGIEFTEFLILSAVDLVGASPHEQQMNGEVCRQAKHPPLPVSPPYPSLAHISPLSLFVQRPL